MRLFLFLLFAFGFVALAVFVRKRQYLFRGAERQHMIAFLEDIVGAGRGHDIFSFLNKKNIKPVFSARVFVYKRFTVPARRNGDFENRLRYNRIRFGNAV